MAAEKKKLTHPSYFLTSLVAQLVKDLPAMQETWVLSLDWEDPLEREWLPTPVFWPVEFHRQRRLVGCSPWGHKELDTTEWISHAHTPILQDEWIFYLASSSPLSLCSIKETGIQTLIRWVILMGFPCGSLVKNLPANAGGMNLIPGLERSHMPRSN